LLLFQENSATNLAICREIRMSLQTRRSVSCAEKSRRVLEVIQKYIYDAEKPRRQRGY